jgi:hypothetical protein
VRGSEGAAVTPGGAQGRVRVQGFGEGGFVTGSLEEVEGGGHRWRVDGDIVASVVGGGGGGGGAESDRAAGGRKPTPGSRGRRPTPGSQRRRQCRGSRIPPIAR